MIRGHDDLKRSLAALGDLYSALAALRHEHGSEPTRFALFAEGPLHAIEHIQREIDQFTGATEARHSQAPLWLRLSGPRARWGETPTSILTAFLDALRKGVQSIAGSIASGSNLGRPTSELQGACDFEIALFSEGSFEVGVRLPDPDQGDLFPIQVQDAARAALHEFLTTAAWAARPLPLVRELEELLPEPKRRRVALRAIKQLVPRREGGVHFVELYGDALKTLNRIHLTPDSSAALAEALAEAVDEKEEVLEGEIREMDLDRRTFRLRPLKSDVEVPCKFGEDLLATAADLLGKKVRVIGMRRAGESGPKGPLSATDIDKLERRTLRRDA